MGAICDGPKKTKVIGQVQEPRQLRAQVSTANIYPPPPLAKCGLILVQQVDSFEQTPIIEVSDALAYNYLVKQGFSNQTGKKQQDVESLLIYHEKCEQYDFFQNLGFHPINLQRLDIIIEQQKTFRILFDFKNIWIFKEYDESLQNLLNTLKEINVKIKQIYYYNRPIKSLYQKFQISGDINITNQCFPPIYFDNSDILDQTKRKDDQFRIFIHNQEYLEQLITQKKSGLYQQNLKVSHIIFLFNEVKFDKWKNLESQLFKLCSFITLDNNNQPNVEIIIKDFIPYMKTLLEMNANVVLIYNNKIPNQQSIARECIEQFLMRICLIPLDEIKKYMDTLRQLIVQQSGLNQHKKTKIIQVEEPQIQQSRCDEIVQLYQQVHKQSKLQVPGMHNTLLKLVQNIIESPSDEKFRLLRSTNKNIKMNITQYKEGKELLKLMGFKEEQENFNNVFDIGMLKLAKGDLELGFKLFNDKI
ncbi:hypothetical protein pb186bvf_014152 [Paramecium bursaria]